MYLPDGSTACLSASQRQPRLRAGGGCSSPCLGRCQVQFVLLGFGQGQNEGEAKAGGAASKSSVLPSSRLISKVLTVGGSSSWFPLRSCKARNCCLTQEQGFTASSSRKKQGKWPGFRSGAVAIIQIRQQIHTPAQEAL